MKTRWLIFVLALCLLTTGYAGAVPPRVQLVCRVSGLPMTPVLQVAAPLAAKTASCCHVRVSPPTSPLQNGPTFALAPGSCCVLHVTTSSDPLPPSTAPFFDVPLAQPPVGVVVPHPVFAAVVCAQRSAARVAPPRAPPARSSLGRAPPFHGFA